MALSALVYGVLLGGTGLGELHPVLRVVNGLVAGGVIVGYVLLAPRRADRIDLACLLALLVFLASALLSAFPRQSLDSALGALTWTAAFFLARILMADADARPWLIRILIGLSVVLTLVAAARWLPSTIEWWMITGVTPPLDMNRSGVLWGHRHDLALVVAVLYPAWWVGARSPIRTAAAMVFGILTAVVVLVDGSRTNWLALVLAGLVVAVPVGLRRWQPERRTLAIAGAVAGVGVVIGFVSGVIPSLLDRLLTTNTLVSRADMWGALLQVWGDRPVNGFGPGSFAWLLQQTDYFDANSWAPRHPDSLPFQVLPEVGLLGVAAIAIVVVALAPGVWRAHWASRFALLAMAFAAIGSNPTEFGFFVLVGIAWAAYAVPHEARPAVATEPARWPRFASIGAVAVIGIAFLSTAVGAFAHDAARREIDRGNLREAASQLRLAERLDPGLALYPRLLGTALFLSGDQNGSLTELRRALNLNQNDDLAWRTLAVLQSESPYPAAARDSIERAVELQRADPTNLLFRNALEHQLGLADLELETAGETIHAWPWLIGGGLPGQDALDLAEARAADGDPAPQSNALNAVWVAALSAQDELLIQAIDGSGLTQTLGDAYAAAVMCDPSVHAYLETAPDTDRRFDEYWALRVRDAAAAGSRDEDAERAWEIMTGRTLYGATPPLNPLDENGFFGLSADTWGYRRPPTTWPDLVGGLPSPDDAYHFWLTDPATFAAASDLPILDGCP